MLILCLCCDKYPTKATEGRKHILALSSRVWSIMVGSHGNEGEAVGRMASMVMKQKAMSTWAQFDFYFLFSLEPLPGNGAMSIYGGFSHLN